MPKPAHNATPTLISCPGCAGVMSIIEEPDGSHVQLVCSVGHTYTLSTLLQAKEDDVERALWAVAAFLEHIQMINELVVRQIDGNHLFIDQAGIERRSRQAEVQGKQIRQMIEESNVADLEPCPRDGKAAS